MASKKYTVGTDLDADLNKSTIKTTWVRETAQQLAHVVHETIYPLPYDKIHYDNGRRFRVRVEEHKTDQDTKPLSLEDMKPDVSIDS